MVKKTQKKIDKKPLVHKKKILITGAGGYVGKCLIQELSARYSEKFTIYATDLKPMEYFPGVQFFQGDIRSLETAKWISSLKPDTVVHLASIVNPGKDSTREFEYSVDVEGTKNVLDACVQGKVNQIIVTSSGAAYGYYEDNPEWLTEAHPIRGNYEFPYSHHKKLIEEMMSQYRKKYPKLKQLILRLGTVLGEGTKNQITNLFEKKIIPGVHGSDSPFVFIWDREVPAIILHGIIKNKEGIYNVAGDGKISIQEIAKRLNKPMIKIPPSVIKIVLSILKKLGLSRYGPEQVIFLQHRPVLYNQQLKENFGYTPQKNTSEVFEIYRKSISRS